MSRPRKFTNGDVALWKKSISGVPPYDEVVSFAVIVDYRSYPTGRGEYRVVRVLHPRNGSPYGEPVWVGPDKLSLMGFPKRKTIVRIYRANQKLEERDCVCQCCAHEALPRDQINKDGTFKWETN